MWTDGANRSVSQRCIVCGVVTAGRLAAEEREHGGDDRRQQRPRQRRDLVALLEPPLEASKMSLALSSILRPQESRMLSRILRLHSFSKEQGPLFKRSVSVSFH